MAYFRRRRYGSYRRRPYRRTYRRPYARRFASSYRRPYRRRAGGYARALTRNKFTCSRKKNTSSYIRDWDGRSVILRSLYGKTKDERLEMREEAKRRMLQYAVKRARDRLNKADGGGSSAGMGSYTRKRARQTSFGSTSTYDSEEGAEQVGPDSDTLTTLS